MNQVAAAGRLIYFDLRLRPFDFLATSSMYEQLQCVVSNGALYLEVSVSGSHSWTFG